MTKTTTITVKIGRNQDPKPDLAIEARLSAEGIWPVAGVDEAGRGPLAGPVAAAAVILDPEDCPEDLDDSKRLTAARRDAAFEAIMVRAQAVAIAFASAAEIDATDIRMATLLAMRRAVHGLALVPKMALVDGRDVPENLLCPGRAIVRGDQLSCSIAAASIVAKVARDRLMVRFARHHPRYGFEKHKGYGTAAHLGAIADHGPCPIHRMSFAPLLR